MDLEALSASPIGQLVPISGTDGRTGEHYKSFAFLVDPLPESVELSSSTWAIVARAEAALARLDQAARQVPSPDLLHAPAIRREAQSTSALEGTFAPFATVLESNLEERGQLSPAVLEILNYVAAAEQAFEWIEDRPLTTGLMGDLQRTLVRGTAGEHSDAGGLRDRQVFIGAEGLPIDRLALSRLRPATSSRRLSRHGLHGSTAPISTSHQSYWLASPTTSSRPCIPTPTAMAASAA
jgi:hypothetical protein